MARCPNRNTPEYKALMGVFKTNLATDNVINAWQDLNKSEAFPTVEEANEFMSRNKTLYALKQREFGEALLGNLSRLRYISRYKDKYYVNNSAISTWDNETWEFNQKELEKNLTLIKRYLRVNNIPEAAVEIRKTKRSYEISVKDNMFSPRDIIEIEKQRTSPRSHALLEHLTKITPGLNIAVMTVGEARAFYESLPEEQKANVPFDKVKSFFVKDQVILIKGRTSNETAIEEILHPFVDGLLIDNPELFDSLLNEAKTNFPVLWQTIQDSYSDRRGFTLQHRNLELVTQALSRHFNKEFETTPTKSFKEKIKEFLEWFASIIKDFNKYLTGVDLVIKPSMIKPNTTLTDLAKLINTSDITLQVDRVADSKVRYSLSPEMQSTLDYALRQSNELQQAVIKRMFNAAMLSDTEFDSLTVTDANPSETSSLVAFHEADHSYMDIVNGEPYLSTTTAIKGKMDPEKEAEVQLNLDIGNEFDMMLTAIASDKLFEDIKDQIKLLDPVKAEAAYSTLHAMYRAVTPEGAVAIPQVVLHDRESKIAGLADLIVITKEGKIRIVDLKTSKNFVRNNESYDGTKWDLPSTSLLKRKGFDKLSTKQQHNLQVAIYRRMAQNMGYEVDQSEFALTTIHIKVDIEGKGKDQKFLGTFQVDDLVPHAPSQNLNMVNALVPLFVDPEVKEELDEEALLSDDTPIDEKTFLDEDEAKMDMLDSAGLTEYAVIGGALEAYKGALIKKQKAIEMIRSNIFMDRSKDETREYIFNSIAAISLARSQDGKVQSALFTQLLKDGLREVRKFVEYIEDPQNFGKPEYISYALNFDRFIETYRGLYSLQDTGDLNATQRSLVLNFQIELNKLKGDKQTEGIIDEAITNYSREIVKSTSSKEFTEAELDDLFTMVQDISYLEYQTGDLATSKDTILAVMDKIYKAKKQELLDKLETRDALIRQKAARLQRLSPNTDPQELYKFMIEFDEDGVPTGSYVQRLGKNYYGKLQELREKLFDENGQWKEYRDVTDLDTASDADIAFNKELSEAREEYGNFWRAETKGLEGKPISGNYHYYDKKFTDERKKYEYYVAAGKHGYWKKKSSVTKKEYAKFVAKYYDEVEYSKAIKDEFGQYTGQIVPGMTIYSPKKKFRLVKDTGRDGVNLLSDKYKSIMENTDTELGRAQKDFYETFVRLYEKELLEKLPMGQRDQMLGRIPLVRARMYQNLKEKPNLVTRLWTKMSRSVRNLVTETAQQKVVITDEEGNLVDSLPIFYTGKARVEGELEEVMAEIDALNQERKDGKININEYKQKKKVLNGRRSTLENQPTLGELNLDLGTALIKFNAMAEHYETMAEAEDTLKALVKSLEARTYQPPGSKELYTKVKGKLVKVGDNTKESNIVKRAKKFMNMVYYDNEEITRGFFDKVADGLISYSSLSYVAFNPFGNFNNYVLGRLNNNIEALGGRFFDKKAYARAVFEFNKRALPDLIKRTSSPDVVRKLGDIATLNQLNLSAGSAYDPRKPFSKYEAFVDLYRMMDPSTDLRESGRQGEKAYQSYFSKLGEFGYILQDAAEYNVQTKVGMAMIMDTQMLNPDTGETLSLYDAMQFDGETQTLRLKDGFTQVIKKNGQTVEYNDQFRYQLRNEIREVNKQIHGNYAREDRMVLQSHAIGRLAAQFHKWVAPAIKARFRPEYYDENLGYMEGRYLSFLKFTKHAFGEIVKGNMEFSKYGKTFMEDYGYKEDGSQSDQYATNKLLNTYRVLGEIAIIFSTIAVSNILQMMFSDDDDDSDFEKRMENFLMYQADRTYKELILMVPISPDSWTQMYQMFKSPIAATRTLGEFGEAISLTMRTPVAMLYYDDREFYGNSSYVYQRGTRAGELKLRKAWGDALPIIYAIQKYANLIQERDFFIK